MASLAIPDFPIPWLALLASFAALVLVAVTMSFLGGKNHMPVEGKTILITGASEGMGLSAARQLSAKGANVIIVSRNVTRLEEAIEEIKAAAKSKSQRFHYISADVSAPDYATAVLANATAWNGGAPLDIVWTIAGTATPGIYADTPFSLTRRMMDINFYGQAEMAHAVLRAWLAPEQPAGGEPKHFIFTNTVVAFFSVLGYGPYAPSKWAIRGLADTLAQEMLLYPQKVEIHVVYPGTILSPGLVKENSTKPEITHILEKDDPQQTPDVVAAKAIRGLERGNHFVTVSWLGHLMRWSGLGGSLRNNTFVDLVMACFVPIIWLFVLPDLLGKIHKFARERGHPSTYAKRHPA